MFYIPGVHKSDSVCEFLLSWKTSIHCGHVYLYNVCYRPMAGPCPTQLFLGDINHSTGVVSWTSLSLGLGGFSLSGESQAFTVVFCFSWATGLHFTLFCFSWAGREPKSLLPFPPIQILLFYLHLSEHRYVKVTYSTGESYLSPIKTHFWLQLRLPITPAKHTPNT